MQERIQNLIERKISEIMQKLGCKSLEELESVLSELEKKERGIQK